MNTLARIEARAKVENLTLTASDAFLRLLGPAIRSGLTLAAMPPSDCRDTRDVVLYAVEWANAPTEPALNPAA